MDDNTSLLNIISPFNNMYVKYVPLTHIYAR